MKEKLMKFSRGVFQYEKTSLLFSQESIEFSIESGKCYEGSFTITTARHLPIKGILSKTDHFLKLSETSFSGTELTIGYVYDATTLPAGETHVGSIYVISNYGEYEIPFMAKVEVPYFMTEIGKIRDLFQFANLAKKDWVSAMKLFKSEEFSKKLLSHDPKNEVLYNSLMKSMSTSHAMEEFLISIHKKVRPNLTVDKSLIEYSNVGETLEDRIVLHKDNWGYMEIQASTDVDFIELERKLIWSENFIGNSCTIGFVVHKDKLKPGNNFGRITIRTQHQTFIVGVSAYGGAENKTDRTAVHEQANLIAITQNYLNFRMGRIDAEQYLEESRHLMNLIYETGNKDYYYLLKAHIAVSTDNQEEMDESFRYLENCKEEWKEENLTLFSAYHYLCAMRKREVEVIEASAEQIQACYDQEPDNWRIFWFLMYVKKEYMEDARKRFLVLTRFLKAGVRSSIIYYEVSMIYRNYPACLKETSEEAVRVMTWMIRENCMGEELKSTYLLAVSKLKKFHPAVYHALENLYQNTKDMEVLQTILSMLVRAQKVGVKYFPWYEMGVKNQVRILQLYECYMYSMEEDLSILLPDSLLTYFAMDCTLHDRKKAFLYANVITNRKLYKAKVIEEYESVIREFTTKELEKHAIGKYLAVLYEELCREGGLDDFVKANLPYVMFQHELRCYDEDITGVIVVHEEVEEEVYTPLEDGVAQIAIYTDSAQIFLVDKKNNRYAESIEYCVEKYLSRNELAKDCMTNAQKNGMLLLYLYEQLETYHNYANAAVALRSRLLLMEELKPDFHWKCYVKLANYYYESSQIALLDDMLRGVNFAYLNVEDRLRMMELCILRGIDYDMEAQFETYGYDKLSGKRIMLFCTKQLKNDPERAHSPLLQRMCYYALEQGRHTKQTMEVLATYFLGTVSQLIKCYEAAKEYDIDTIILEEQIISQSLFAQVEKEQTLEAFLAYNKREEKNKLVVRAYLSYHGYNYLLKDCELKEEIVQVMRDYIAVNNCSIIAMAYLKWLSVKPELTVQEKEYAEIQMHQNIKEEIILPFFVNFKKHMALPYEIDNKYMISYCGNVGSKVILHYALNSNHFTDEVLKNRYQGIFNKPFVLFHGDCLSYYFTEIRGGEEITSEVVTLTYEDDMSETDSEFSILNSLIVAKEMQDTKTVLNLVKQYAAIKTIIAEEFKMLD